MTQINVKYNATYFLLLSWAVYEAHARLVSLQDVLLLCSCYSHDNVRTEGAGTNIEQLLGVVLFSSLYYVPKICSKLDFVES